MLITVVVGLALVLPPSSPAHADAGRERSDYRVIGGQPAQEGAWASIVALIRAEDPDDVTGQLCAGTAIAADLVLTAAHCFYNESGGVTRTPDQIRVIAGRQDLSAPGGVVRTGTAVYVHPAYDVRRRRHDLAVLRVDGDLGVPLQPLIERNGAGPFEEDKVVVAGWGRRASGEANASRHTAVLHEAVVGVTDHTTCSGAYGATLELRVHLCAGGGGTPEAPGADACVGDSGGPLMLMDPVSGTAVQVGITSFGPWPCGVGQPGVYTRLATMRGLVDAVVDGTAQATILPGADVPAPTTPDAGVAVRVAAAGADATTPIDQAVAASRAFFDVRRAELAIIARDDAFADALAGSTLGYGRGPLLYTPATGPLAEATRDELVRSVQPGGTVYLLGGEAAVPAEVEVEVAALGFEPRRLAGATREETAVAIGEEVVRRHGHGRLPFATAILVTSHAWPDAVLAGQLGAWWGFPVLLTPAEELHHASAEAIEAMGVRRLLVVGGGNAVHESVLDRLRATVPALDLQRLAGTSRIETGVAVTRWHREELARRGARPPGAVVAVNLRREDGFAHVLAATPLLGATAGMFLPVEGDTGDALGDDVVAAFCGAGGLPFVMGGVDLVSEDVAGRLGGILAGTDC